MSEIAIEGLRELSADLGKIASRALPDVDAVLKKGAENIKTEMASDAESSTHFRGLARTISYDSSYRIGEAAYEIGPDKDRGGAAALGNIAYFGGANGGGGTLDIDAPLAHEEPRLMAALDKALGALL